MSAGVVPAGGYVLVLEGYATPLLNVTLRQHWSRRLRGTRALAWLIRAAVHGAPPARPLPRAAVEIVRWSIGTPDQDGLVGGCKSLLDCLQPMDPKRRPYGLGFIEADDPAHLQLEVRAAKARTRAEIRTVVTIRPMPVPA